MLLRGSFLFETEANEPVHTFAIVHPQIPQLIQARVRILRFAPGRYVYSSQASLILDETASGFRSTRLRGARLWRFAAASVLKRPSWKLLRLLLKALLRNKPSALDDLLAAAWMDGIETNDGKQVGEEVVFADGTRCPLVTKVTRHRPFSRSKLVLFPHFEPDGAVTDLDVTTLKLLDEAGYDTVVLSTNVKDEALGRLGFVTAVVVRPNVGHDFFSWKVGFHLFGEEIRRSHHVLLLNNSVSVSGPQTLVELDNLPDGFGCLLDSPSSGYHAESYCVLFKNLGQENALLFEFFQGVIVHQAKQRVILDYEIGLSRFFLDRGFFLHAVRPYQTLIERVHERRAQYPALSALLAADPIQSSCTTFRSYLIDEGFTILKKRTHS